MQRIKLFIAIIIAFLLSSCSDGNNPTSPSINNSIYLGGVGTERTYKETVSWLEIGSNLPFFNVPDSLITKVTLSEAQLQNGICEIMDYTEIVEYVDEDFYASWKFTLPRTNYIQFDGDGKIYDLSCELDSLVNNKTYSPGGFSTGHGVFKVFDYTIFTTNPPDLQKQFPSVPYIKNTLQINDSWIRYKFIDTTTNNSIIETVAKVIGKEEIQVTAGTFSAIKIKLTTYHFNPDYSFDDGYEYYVPNVGLVLKESDSDIYQWNSKNNETIHFRQTKKKELISYFFVGE